MPTLTSNKYFPLPGYSGTIQAHGGVYNGGSDIFAPAGTPVRAVVGGTVTFTCTQAQCSSTGGNSLTIHGADGLDYYYAHLQGPPPARGTVLQSGQVFGAVGNTGNAASTPSHLHIGIGTSISDGVGAAGGIGENFNAVALLRQLLLDPVANSRNSPSGSVSTPGTLNYVPAVPGFTSANEPWIRTAIASAQKYGLDIATFLGVIARESAFDINARNPQSGACGPAQLYPCQPGLTSAQNIDAGAKTLRDKLDACKGDYNCALNAYSGGAGAPYANDVKKFANAILSANPSLQNAGVDATAGGAGGSTGGSGNSTAADCPTVGFGPWQIPDLACVITNGITGAWNNIWQIIRDAFHGLVANFATNDLTDWIFVGVGLALTYMGLNQMIAHDTGTARAVGAGTGVAKTVATVAALA